MCANSSASASFGKFEKGAAHLAKALSFPRGGAARPPVLVWWTSKHPALERVRIPPWGHTPLSIDRK